jgi:hypothetical protein
MIIHRDIGSTTSKQNSKVELLPSHSGERRGGVGEGEEVARGNFGSGFPSNFPPTTDYNLSIFSF